MALKTYQYNDTNGDFDPQLDTGETKWIAAHTKKAADAYARSRGWDQCGGQIYDAADTARDDGGVDVMIDESGRAHRRKADGSGEWVPL